MRLGKKMRGERGGRLVTKSKLKHLGTRTKHSSRGMGNGENGEMRPFMVDQYKNKGRNSVGRLLAEILRKEGNS